MRFDRALVVSFLVTAVAACAHPGANRTCAPTLSWASPAYVCTTGAPAAAPEPEAPPPAPEPEAEPPPEPVAEVVSDTIELRESVQFETGSPVLLDRSKEVLDEVVKVMTDHPELRVVEIRGHTDGEGSTRSNQRLSDRRAAAVRTYLIDHGVAKGRLKSKGFGESQPVADNETPEGRAQNRRVELQILERD